MLFIRLTHLKKQSICLYSSKPDTSFKCKFVELGHRVLRSKQLLAVISYSFLLCGDFQKGFASVFS